MTTTDTPNDRANSVRSARHEYSHSPDFADCRTAVVIDGDERIRAQLVQTLEAAGYATDACANGIEGVETVLATSPDLVTVEVNLLGIDGILVIRRIREAGSTAHIIVISGLQDESDKILSFTAGADDYVTKPFRPRELRARIDAVTRRSTQQATKTRHTA